MSSAGSNRAAPTGGRTSPSSPTEPAHDALAAVLERRSRSTGHRPGTAPAVDDPVPTADRHAAHGRALPAGSIIVDADLGDRVLPRRPGASVRGEEPAPAAAAGGDARPGPRLPRRADRRRTRRARRPVRHLPAALRRRSTPTTSSRSRGVKRRGDDDVDDTVDEATGERTQARRRYPKLEGFRTDPSWWSVAALEVFDDDTGDGDPGADPATPDPRPQRPRRGPTGPPRSSRPSPTRWPAGTASTPRYVADAARRRPRRRRDAAGRDRLPDAGRRLGARRALPGR